MLLFGKISEVDATKGLARVQFEQYDGLVSDWLLISTSFTLEDQHQVPLRINQKVWCMMDERCEDGVIGGAVYDETNNPSGGNANKYRTKFKDGLTIEYDRSTKLLKVSGTGDVKADVTGDVEIKCANAKIEASSTATVKATVKVSLDAPLVEATAIIKCATLQVGAIQPGTPGAALTMTGDFDITGEMKATTVKQGAIQLGTHKHSGVTTGAGTSGPAIP